MSESRRSSFQHMDAPVVPSVFVAESGYTHIGLLNFVPGDYDRNGIVEAADYDEWKTDFGTIVTSPGLGSDGNFDGIVNLADYSIWLHNLGTVFPVTTNIVQVPEPATSLLAMLCLLGQTFRPRQTRQHLNLTANYS